MAKDEFEETRVRLLQLLLRKIDEDTYPSSTMMDTAEELLKPDDVSEYADVLLAKIEDDAYPSIPMIDRLRNLHIS